MVDSIKTGRYIALCRKAAGNTQEQLAQTLGISAQAVSKWETGQSLPDTALLPDLARALRTTIDRLLTPGRLFIRSAVLTDGDITKDVTEQISAAITGDSLDIADIAAYLADRLHPERFLYLIIKWDYDGAARTGFAPQDGALRVGADTAGTLLPADGYTLLDARYGNARANNDAAHRLSHMLVFGHEAYHVNHHTFDSAPSAAGEERLTVLFAGSEDLHAIAVPEGWQILPTRDGFVKRETPDGTRHFIRNVPPLGFRRDMECTWAGAMTHALNALGHQTTYEDVMGASGACYRINFLHPMWDYSSVDGLVVHSHDIPLFAAYGHEMLLGNPAKEHRDAERAHILRDIEQGKPVVCINLRVAHEWGLITGYSTQQDGPEKLWCRTYFEDPTPEETATLPPEEIYAQVENWPFIILHFGNARSMLPPEEALQNSLRTFVACMTSEESSRGYVSGLRAYRTWRDALRDAKTFDELPEEVFRRRLGVNHFCMLALTDARRSAGDYLAKSIPFAAQPARLEALAECFAKMYALLQEVFAKLPDDCEQDLGGRDPRAVWTPALREEQASAFDVCIALEQEALETAKDLLRE